MDGSRPVSCPPLPFERFQSNLVVSGTSRAIGNIVEFSCTGVDDILWGSTVLQCSETGQWNGSVPTCVHRDEITTLSYTSTPVSTLSTTQTGPTEFKVDTVVIFLWITGGLLLITLSVLIGCVLRNHKKRQQNRNGTSSGNGQGSPRHGGVNPTFTNYDEIWTWIPVVTNNNENCRSQQNSASARESSTQRANTELMRTLRLPTYSEAVNSATSNVRNTSNPSQNRNLLPHVTNQRHTSQTNDVSVRPANITDNNAVSVSRDVRRNTHSGLRSENPCDPTTAPSCSQINRNNVTQINVTRGGSALQQARDFINQISAHPQRPQPSAPVYIHSSNLLRDERSSGTRESSSGNVRPSSSANVPVPSIHSSRQHRTSSSQQCVRPTDFSHSDRSVFMRYNGNERNVVRTYEQPPPYSEFRADAPISRCQGVASVSGLMTSQTSVLSSEVALHTRNDVNFPNTDVIFLNTDVNFPNTDVNFPNTDVNFPNTVSDVNFLNTNVNFPNTNVSFPNTDVKFLNTDVIFPNTDVNFLNTDVIFPNTDVNFLNTDVDFPVTDVNFLNTDVNFPNTDVNLPNTDVNFPNTDVNFLNTDVNILNTDVNFLNTDVNFLNTDVNFPNTDVNFPNTDVNILNTDVNFPVTDVNFLNTDVNIPNTDVNFPNTDVNFLNTDVNILNTDVNFLNTDVNFLNTDVNFLNTDVNFPNTDVNFPNTDHDFPVTDVNFLNTDVNILNTDVNFLNTDVNFPITDVNFPNIYFLIARFI